MAMLTPEQFVSLVDHTILKAESTQEDVSRVCQEAVEHQCRSVCVNGTWVPLAASIAENSDTRVCAVVGFPLGAMSTDSKAEEARQLVSAGAGEIDMVVNVGRLRSGQNDQVLEDIRAVRVATGDGVVLKVILETAVLSDDEISRACKAAQDAGADFVKTSTGFHPAGGATVHAVQLMRQSVGDSLGVKASGGIRTLADAESMIEAGATRLGLSGTLAILKELERRNR